MLGVFRLHSRLGTPDISPFQNLRAYRKMVKLFCALVGVRGSAFEVKIDEGASVSALNKEIKKEKMYQIPADELQLYLAKTANDAWLDGAGSAAVMLDGNGHLQGFKKMDPTLWIAMTCILERILDWLREMFTCWWWFRSVTWRMAHGAR